MALNRKRLIIVAEVLVGALIAGIITYLLIRSQTKLVRNCANSDEMPLLDLDKLKNIAAHDNKSLIGISAYLKFSSSLTDGQGGETNTFSQLQINNVTLTPGKWGSQELILESACNRVMLMLKRSARVIDVENIRVDPLGDSETESCVTGPTGVYFGEENSYICYSRQVLPCYKVKSKKSNSGTTSSMDAGHQTKTLDLVIEALRFEVNGNPKKISAGTFSKPPHFCF